MGQTPLRSPRHRFLRMEIGHPGAALPHLARNPKALLARRAISGRRSSHLDRPGIQLLKVNSRPAARRAARKRARLVARRSQRHAWALVIIPNRLCPHPHFICFCSKSPRSINTTSTCCDGATLKRGVNASWRSAILFMRIRTESFVWAYRLHILTILNPG